MSKLKFVSLNLEKSDQVNIELDCFCNLSLHELLNTSYFIVTQADITKIVESKCISKNYLQDLNKMLGQKPTTVFKDCVGNYSSEIPLDVPFLKLYNLPYGVTGVRCTFEFKLEVMTSFLEIIKMIDKNLYKDLFERMSDF